ncbi:thioesterase II family protein [Streptomyces ipomoeae]|uniref:Thioesterase domain protein n=2 Tax=Streptomyces ipomoeae TaxID=103232 RepID=L1KMH2_9ACTN|nr:alpha/beta fold hydrolase [Streptomyces ipomoeae]EKX61593.1 thioesterase domain protein [Streptomyces ipomoeae 91-03]MDX2693324.1 alpha/beta fold hydrolase [Streptomyces ipomoeae]MDX2838977.1 alpha/beta fold hydrolase [Streptomyces ipomoeae]
MAAWFDMARAVPSGWPRTYCFAHAGGRAQAFVEWQDALAGATALVAVTPPERMGIDTVCDRVAELIAAQRTGPFLLFGHSLGALIAFEVARRLGDRPAHLIASGCVAPSLHPTPRMVEVAGLDGQGLTDALAVYGGLRPEILADPELQEFILPDIRDDFKMVAEYRYRPAEALPFGVSLVNGTDDPLVRPDDLADWTRECVNEPETHWSEGGHFYFENHPEAVTEVIRRAAEALPVELI